MGIATLLVLFIHGNTFQWSKKLHTIYMLTYEGSVGVEIFLFLSGIGLYFSLNKDKNILQFYKRRFLRIIPSYLIIAAPLEFIVEFVIGSKNISNYLQSLSQIDFWLPQKDLGLWYVAFIIPLYFLYPLLHAVINRFNSKKYTVLQLLIILSLLLEVILIVLCPEYFRKIEIGITRLPIFFTGCCCAYLVQEKAEIKSLPLKIITCLAVYLGIRVFNILCIERDSLLYNSLIRKARYFLALAIMWSSCIAFNKMTTYKNTLIKKVMRSLQFFGRNSFEIYITHCLVIAIYLNCQITIPYREFWIYYLLIAPISVAIATLGRHTAIRITERQ